MRAYGHAPSATDAFFGVVGDFSVNEGYGRHVALVDAGAAMGAMCMIDAHPEPLERHHRAGRFGREVFPGRPERAAAVAAVTDREKFAAVADAPDEIIDLDPPRHGNEAVFDGPVEMGNRFCLRYMAGDPRVYLAGSLAEKRAPVLDGMVMAVPGVAARAAVDDDPVG